MLEDVIIIGGNFAGLAAAMPLARARRRVLVVDAGQPRNRFAEAAHGFPGQDGVAPSLLTARLRAELAAYDTVRFCEDRVERAGGGMDDFTVTLASGAVERGRRLVLALGVTDTLPAIAGLAERWGETVLHCPYCHGYEVAGQPLGVLAAGPGSDHRALLIADWGPTILFTQGQDLADPDLRERLAARGVVIEPVPLVALQGQGRGLTAAQLQDGRAVPLAALFVVPQTQPAGAVATQLGCALEEGMTGPQIRVDALKQTSVEGVFAAGDAASGMHSGLLAAAAGMMAGVAAHRSLL